MPHRDTKNAEMGLINQTKIVPSIKTLRQKCPNRNRSVEDRKPCPQRTAETKRQMCVTERGGEIKSE